MGVAILGGAQGACAGGQRALREEGSRAPAASTRPRCAKCRPRGRSRKRRAKRTDAVAQVDQVEIFAGRTLARSEDALLRPQEGTIRSIARAETFAPRPGGGRRRSSTPLRPLVAYNYWT
ncbi:unnamed protein product [Leptosia nina]|uniref:Uncharacterized protein n=1 Tax=Leptosia nina TaxID=320188 RepID=A0AAV1JSA8_9NEOP